MLKALKSIVNVKRPYSRVTELEAESDSDEAGTDGVFDNGVDFQKSAITGVGPFKIPSKQRQAGCPPGKQNDSYMSETASIDIEMAKVARYAKAKETLESEVSDGDDKPESLTHALDLPPLWEKPGDRDILTTHGAFQQKLNKEKYRVRISVLLDQIKNSTSSI